MVAFPLPCCLPEAILSWEPPPQDSCIIGLSVSYLMFCLAESRCDKDLDTLSGYAMCLPNLTRLQTYHFAEHRPILCVEIKVGFPSWWHDTTGEGKGGSQAMSLPESLWVCLECVFSLS